MNNVLPESMEQLPEDTKEAIVIIDKYIRYMSERIDLALRSISSNNVAFDNDKSGLNSTNVEDAIKELRRLI